MRTVPTHAEVGKQLRCEVVMRGSMSISQPDGHIRVRQAGIGKSQVQGWAMPVLQKSLSSSH